MLTNSNNLPMVVQVSGDPRRPNELHAFKQLPPTAEDQTPGALLLLSMGFGMAALLLKVHCCVLEARFASKLWT